MTLIVPGVRVEARFDVLPPLPAPSGIVGIAGIVDRAPQAAGLVGVTSAAELRELLGPGTETSMPAAVHALGNGARELIVSPVAGGGPAFCTLRNLDGNPALILRCRANGAWGNSLRADVRGIANAAGEVVRIGLRLLQNGDEVERYSDLQVAPGEVDDLLDTVNRQSRYVVAVDPGFDDDSPTFNTYAFGADGAPIDVPRLGGTDSLLQLIPAPDVTPEGLSIRIDGPSANRIRVRVFQGGLQEEFTDLTMNPDSDRHLPYVLLTASRLVRVRTASSLPPAARLPAATLEPAVFAEGSSPTTAQYSTAIDLLTEDPRIDIVLAAIEPGRNRDQVRTIHQALVAHAVTLADNGAPRIAFGSVATDEQNDLGRIRDHAAAARNRRFVLISPSGADGAVAGMVARMNPMDAPTFKPVPLFGLAPATYRESELNRLLGPTTNALVVQARAGRGVVVLKGIDTTGDQISVTRVADNCIRETKAIAENFIGQLNSENARISLREQIVATFTRLERAGALVASTDGTDPAFVVNVYSTQQDFAQGIVRIDIAVRPVRAIDYVYATIRVKN